jgi:hypothetical protein
MTKATSTTLDLVSLATGVGESLAEMKGALDKAESLKDAINKNIAALHNAKAKVGTYKKDGTGCALATAFVDGCVAKGLTQSTAQKTYLPTFKAHVASGKPVTQWNLQRAKKPAQGAAQGAGKTLAQKLATVYRDAGFAEFCQALQDSFEGAECDSLHEGIESYLILNGALKEDEGK